MMKRTAYLLTLLVTAGLAAVSCLNKEEIDDRLNDLEQRISRLEEAAGEANSNSIALHALMQKETVIVGFEELEHGYELELSDGKKITVTDGINAPSIVPIVGIDDDGNWIMSIDNGGNFTPIAGAQNAFSKTGQTPLLKVDGEGFWLISTDGGETYEKIIGENGKPQSATNGVITGDLSTFFKDVVYDTEKKELTITLIEGEPLVIPVVETFFLNVSGYKDKALMHLDQTLEYKVEMSDVKGAFFQVPKGWAAVLTDEALEVTGPASGTAGEYKIGLVLTSVDGYIKHMEFTFTLNPVTVDDAMCDIYRDWVENKETNVLLDFSYAGYNYGETAPLEASAWGYTVYDVTAYGAVANDGKSDREAFKKCLEAATGQTFVSGKTTLTLGHKEKANAIIYFPEGEFILHTSEDNHTYTDGKTYSQAIMIRSGNIILRGAGRDKTTLVMDDPNLPTSEALYSSPDMIMFKHNSDIGRNANCAVTKNASKGSFSVEVAATTGLSEDQWVCLTLKNNDPACVAKELEDGHPTAAEMAAMTDIVNEGVKVFEYHKIRKIEGNTVTFYEPIMKDVDIQYTNFTNSEDYCNWSVQDYPHYENVGVEDLTFKGFAKEDFKHHGTWQDDGAFKPVQFSRVVNSWLRRVRFTSVSEALTVSSSANVSVYDVEIDGNRGHSSIRSQGSSRVFIGATVDHSDGALVNGGAYREGAGQFHAVGVSKPSMGAVLWRNTWGSDSCFESHATQPRATLIDCCEGGWMTSRQGGDENQVPNHLADLTVWNFNATSTPNAGTWNWWRHDSNWWKFLPPVIAGFHGNAVTFNPDQTKVDFSNGTPVYPESLYEAQLKKRLGAVPTWLNSLK